MLLSQAKDLEPYNAAESIALYEQAIAIEETPALHSTVASLIISSGADVSIASKHYQLAVALDPTYTEAGRCVVGSMHAHVYNRGTSVSVMSS